MDQYGYDGRLPDMSDQSNPESIDDIFQKLNEKVQAVERNERFISDTLNRAVQSKQPQIDRINGNNRHFKELIQEKEKLILLVGQKREELNSELLKMKIRASTVQLLDSQINEILQKESKITQQFEALTHVDYGGHLNRQLSCISEPLADLTSKLDRFCCHRPIKQKDLRLDQTFGEVLNKQIQANNREKELRDQLRERKEKKKSEDGTDGQVHIWQLKTKIQAEIEEGKKLKSQKEGMERAIKALENRNKAKKIQLRNQVDKVKKMTD